MSIKGLVKTQEEFVIDTYNKYKNEYSVIGEYKNSKTKIKIKHNLCGNEWNITPNNFLNGHGCPKCAGSELKNTKIFKQEILIMCGNEYEVLGDYKNSHTKILMKHNILECNYKWEVQPYSFLNGRRCPICSKKHSTDLKRRTQSEFEEEIYDLTNNEYIVVGKYVNALTKVKMKHNCSKCNNHEWEVTPNDFINNSSRCPMCNRSFLKTTKEFKQEVFDLVGNEYEVLDTYINNSVKIKVRHNCEKCNYNEYKVTPHNFLSGNRCPICKEVKGEKSIREFFIKNNIHFISQKKFKDLIGLGKGKLSYDFYLPNYNLLIEYQGKYHDGTARIQTKEAFKKQQEHDKRKKEYAQNHNIRLLEIWYYDYDKIEEILNNIIK